MNCEIAVIVATFNRPHMTRSCLESLFRSAKASRLSIGIQVVDASSAPDTAQLLENSFPEVSVSRVNESSFWAESMRTAWEEIQDWNYNYVMWLNDDVILVPKALLHLHEIAKENGDWVIAVGATQSPSTGLMTYGGRRIGPALFPLHGPRLSPNGTHQAIQLFEGNIVLIPRSIDTRLGGFPAGYRHTMADTAYGLKATKMGIPILLSRIFLGLCEANPSAEAWRDSQLPPIERWKLLTSAKVRPVGPWFRLCREIGTPTWPLYFLSGYLRVIAAVLVEFVTGAASGRQMKS